MLKVVLNATAELSQWLGLPHDMENKRQKSEDLNLEPTTKTLVEEREAAGTLSNAQQSCWQLHLFVIPKSKQHVLISIEYFSQAIILMPLEARVNAGSLQHSLMMRWCNELAYLANESEQLTESQLPGFIGKFMKIQKKVSWQRHVSVHMQQQLAATQHQLTHFLNKHQLSYLSEQQSIELTENLNHRRRANMDMADSYYVPCHRLLADGLFRFASGLGGKGDFESFENPYQALLEHREIAYNVTNLIPIQKHFDLPENVICLTSYRDKVKPPSKT